ncbi:hypothetical protein WJX72_008143 [[Myrmecia] bisecta]|uniref:Uncharacterized protein n=1 Tax=[Myrmecia] bisecta TaxID=41462 RepID=A0AAW1Q0B6_9CHLO
MKVPGTILAGSLSRGQLHKWQQQGFQARLVPANEESQKLPRNKPIVLEILYRMMVLKHPERRALADLQEHETAAGTVAKFSKWLKANGKCQGKDKQKEAKDQLTQLVNILRPADAVVRS